MSDKRTQLTECPYPGCEYVIQGQFTAFETHEQLAHATEDRPDSLQLNTCPVCDSVYVNSFTVSTSTRKPKGDFKSKPKIREDYTVCIDKSLASLKEYYVHST